MLWHVNTIILTFTKYAILAIIEFLSMDGWGDGNCKTNEVWFWILQK